jgi:hypothetical protein
MPILFLLVSFELPGLLNTLPHCALPDGPDDCATSVRMTEQHARCAVVAFRSASQRQLLVIWLIVAFYFFAIRASLAVVSF